VSVFWQALKELLCFSAQEAVAESINQQTVNCANGGKQVADDKSAGQTHEGRDVLEERS